MKYTFYLLMVCAILTSCYEEKESFLDFYEISSPLTEASFEIASRYKSQPIVAKINNGGLIWGVGNGKRFYTNDFFETVDYSSGFDMFSYDGDIGSECVKHIKDDNILSLSISTNHGFSFNDFMDIDIGYVFDDEYTVNFLSPNEGWVALPRYDGMEIIKVSNNQYSTISHIPEPTLYSDNIPVSLSFRDVLNGWLLMEEDSFEDYYRIYSTTDGGITWQGGYSIQVNSEDPINTIRGFNNLVYLYYESSFGTRNHVYISQDKGETWNYKSGNMRSYQFIDDKNGYAIEDIDYSYSWEDDKLASKGILAKTSNGGFTWEPVSSQQIFADRIYFINSDIGLAMSYSVLQLTDDGGENWHPLIYPVEQFME